MERRRVIVRGAVQGVFFRDSCRRAALDASVNGWVRNCPDGSVEAVFEGDREETRHLWGDHRRAREPAANHSPLEQPPWPLQTSR